MKTFELEGKGREIVARSADQKRALKAMRKNNENLRSVNQLTNGFFCNREVSYFFATV